MQERRRSADLQATHLAEQHGRAATLQQRRREAFQIERDVKIAAHSRLRASRKRLEADAASLHLILAVEENDRPLLVVLLQNHVYLLPTKLVASAALPAAFVGALAFALKQAHTEQQRAELQSTELTERVRGAARALVAAPAAQLRRRRSIIPIEAIDAALEAAAALSSASASSPASSKAAVAVKSEIVESADRVLPAPDFVFSRLEIKRIGDTKFALFDIDGNARKFVAVGA